MIAAHAVINELDALSYPLILHFVTSFPYAPFTGYPFLNANDTEGCIPAAFASVYSLIHQ